MGHRQCKGYVAFGVGVGGACSAIPRCCLVSLPRLPVFGLGSGMC